MMSMAIMIIELTILLLTKFTNLTAFISTTQRASVRLAENNGYRLKNGMKLIQTNQYRYKVCICIVCAVFIVRYRANNYHMVLFEEQM